MKEPIAANSIEQLTRACWSAQLLLCIKPEGTSVHTCAVALVGSSCITYKSLNECCTITFDAWPHALRRSKLVAPPLSMAVIDKVFKSAVTSRHKQLA
jgi:hypothetical protein